MGRVVFLFFSFGVKFSKKHITTPFPGTSKEGISVKHPVCPGIQFTGPLKAGLSPCIDSILSISSPKVNLIGREP